MAFSKEQKKEMIQSVKYWYHTIDLGEGLFTPGWEMIRSMNQTMLDFLPISLKGLSILDIGCWDGLFSFEAEKRGASRVLGIDNLAGGDGFSQDKLESIKGDGFKPFMIAKMILGSNAEYQMMNVYDISPENIGEFDCTIFFGVLYHLWHPMLALQLIRRVTKRCLFIETHVNEVIDQSQPLIRFYPRGEKYEASTWVGPNLVALHEMLLSVGFKKVMLYRFRDYYERAIGMAFVDEKHFKEFEFKHDDQFVPFDSEKLGKSYSKKSLDPAERPSAQMTRINELQRTYEEAESDQLVRLELMNHQAQKLERLHHSLESMKASRSSRATAPLRWLRHQWHHFFWKSFIRTLRLERASLVRNWARVPYSPRGNPVKKYVYQPETRMGDFEKCVEILRQGRRVIPEWVNNLPIEVLDRVKEGFDQQGIPVRTLYVDPEIYRQYLKQAGYTERYPNYYRDYLPEKSFEHFIVWKLLEINSRDVFIDVASENSPAPDIYSRLSGCTSYRQDIMYPPGIHGDRIGGNACEMPVPDQFASKLALTCSLEHFEGMEDQKLFFEMNRILKVGGKLCVVPLYMYTVPANQTDPTISVSNHVEFDPDVIVYCAERWGNRFGRFYSVDSFMDRIFAPTRNLFNFEVFRIMNATEVDHKIYARFALIATKK